MGLISQLGRYAWRKWKLDGVSSSGPNEPDTVDIFPFVDAIDQQVAAITAAGNFRGEWNASSGAFPGGGTAEKGDTWLVTTAGTTGGRFFAVGDRIVALMDNASATTFAGSWGVIPANARTVVPGEDTGEGTANAIQVTTEDAVTAGTMVFFTVFRANGPGPTTVQFNGSGPAYTVKTNSGTDPAEGGLVAGLSVLGIVSGATFRLVNDQISSAIVAAAEAAQVAAEAAAASVAALISIYDTEAAASAAEISALVHAVRLNGGVAVGDGLGGLYIDQPNGRPASFASSGATARSWYRATDARGESHVGQIATRSVIPGFSNTTNKQIMSRTRHFARDQITELQLLYPNWFHNGNTETGIDGSITVSASVEYPVGEFHQVTWGGAASTAIADRTTSAPSDLLAINIPDGAEFFIRTYSTSATGILFSATEDSAHGEGAEFGPSGITDKTMGGTIADSGTNAVYGPCAIIGTMSKPSVFVIGDSRESAAGFDTPNYLSVIGHVARAIAPTCAYIDVSRGGERLAEFVASHARRIALAQYCSHVVIHMGINDFTAGQTSAGALADLDTIIGLLPNQEVWLGTVEPVTTSSDGWTSVSGQTIDAASNSARISYNNAIRSGVDGVAGYFDIADVFESARDSGKWKAPAGAPLTSDGTHQTLAGYHWGEQSGVISTSSFFVGGALKFPRFASAQEVRERRVSGLPIDPAALGLPLAFKVTKNAADQVVTTGASTKLTWAAEAFDTVNAFDLINARWTPPAGRYRLHAQVYVTVNVVDAAQFQIRIAKNGATAAEYVLRPSGTSAQSLAIDAIFEADGDDYFEAWVNLGGTGDKTVSGDVTRTYFEGHAI
ncbi:hypothetical protein J2046_000261 [Rhizobium petrolearium]|uniref:SGNH/GDSL hydrolase family protein n=1 Tax=Neorhizobium petrolearium TaxID=515361 RepID=UPI001AE89279|nr:SGNH/GDSL hydrolase family protein [Neorhizobium petrolearium]MBP1842017.1 hypothetical protein [Neorhizobium petrolearium]